MSSRLGTVIYLSGPVGAGKTTVARELATLVVGPLAHIEGDRFWPFVARPAKKARRESFILLMRSMTAAALPFAKSGYTVLIDFSIPPGFLPTARKILKQTPLDYIVLKPDIDICQARAAARCEGKIDDYAPYREFYELFQVHPRHVLDDDCDPKSLAARIEREREMGAFRVEEEGCAALE